jgi:hypothetical protein
MKNNELLASERMSVLGTCKIKIGQEVQRYGRSSGKLRYNTECRQRAKFVITFISPLELFLRRTNAQVVEDHIPLY